MAHAVRWFIRWCGIAALILVWLLLPVFMPGPSRALAVLHFLTLVALFNVGSLALFGSLIRRPGQAAAQPRAPMSQADRADMMRAARAQEERADRSEPRARR